MKRKFSKRAFLISVAVFFAFVTAYTFHHKITEEKLMEDYVNFLKPHVWQLNMKEVRNLADVIFKSSPIFYIKVVDETGEPLLVAEKKLSTLDDIFLKLKLAWIRDYELEMFYRDSYIGSVHFKSLVNLVPVYSLGLALGIALYMVILYYLNLHYTAKELERTNAELRNVVEELETTIEELERAQEQLINSEKMASLGRLIAGIAHDINTPTGIVYTSISELEAKMDEIEKEYNSGRLSKSSFEDFLNVSKDLLSLMRKNIKRVVDLLRSLKNVSAQEVEGRPIRFNVKDYIEDVLETLGPRLKRTKVKIHVECPDNLEMRSLPSVLAQIISNLIENSIIHGFENGEKEGNIWIVVRDRGDFVELLYKDDGKGMEEGVKDKAFEPFFTTRREEGGSGLGLSIVYTLVVEKLGGEISLRSEPSKGVQFTILIPKETK